MPPILLFILISFLILVGAWGVFIEPKHIKAEKLSLKIENLPPSFKNFKILHLSDLHSKEFGKKEKKVLEILSQLNPDLVLITGDIVDKRTENLKDCQNFWKALSQNYEGRIFAVYGNHDHRNKNFKILNNFLKESGIEILNNQTKEIKRGRDLIYLVGTDDPHLGLDDIDEAMKGAGSDFPKILLAHSPEIFRKVKGKNIDLVLTGHTHGGQINIPILTDLVLPLKYDKKYKSGLFKENFSYLYVNRGVGETLLPIRINASPEAALIELQ